MSSEYRKLVDKSKYQVFLMACPANIPCNFAAHTWFVVNEMGKLSRWEVNIEAYKRRHNCWAHLDENINPIFQGISWFTYTEKPCWKPRLIDFITGDESSEAKKMADFILNSWKNYPNEDKYFLLGPNSNTYPQWILDNFPSFPGNLPWNAVGKGYKRA